MGILGRRRDRKCFLCKIRTAAKNATVCTECMKNLKMGSK